MTARQYGWIAAVSGLATLVFGLLALLWPGLTLSLLILLFSAYVIIEGLAALLATFKAMNANEAWWPHLVIGIASITAGIYALANPGMTGMLLLYVIAAWAIVVGLAQIAAAFLEGQPASSVIGLVTAAFGALLLAFQARGALALVVLIGAFGIVRGLLQLLRALNIEVGPAS
jgi:uncharacterized membrane protein HdeD (DUF308 family)